MQVQHNKEQLRGVRRPTLATRTRTWCPEGAQVGHPVSSPVGRQRRWVTRKKKNGRCGASWTIQMKTGCSYPCSELAPAEAGIASWQVSGEIAGRSFMPRGPGTPVGDFPVSIPAFPLWDASLHLSPYPLLRRFCPHVTNESFKSAPRQA